jgi:hypothetical protein
MKGGSDFISLLDYLFSCKEVETLDDSKAFHSVSFFSKKFNVKLEDIIATWLDNKINLYINLRAEYCRINRYANKKEYRYNIGEIRTGRDFYQDESTHSPSVRSFIPCWESEIKEYMVFKEGYDYQYIYNGYASGYWRLHPTSITHLVRDNYNLKNAKDDWTNIPGEVKVYGRDENDYLLFNKNIAIPHAELFVDNCSYQKLIQTLLPDCDESIEIENYYLQNLIVALLISRHYRKANKELKILSASDSLNADRKLVRGEHIKAVSRSSLSRWLKDVFKQDGSLTIPMKNGRRTPEKDDVIYIIAKAYYWSDDKNVTFESLVNALLEECEKFTLQEKITSSQLMKYLKDITSLSAQ